MKTLHTKQSAWAVLSLLSLVFLTAGQAAASAITYTGSSGNLSASVTFSLTGNVLTVDLINTSNQDVLLPADILTAVFFNTTHTLTPVSAALNGSSVFYKSLSNVGDGWGYYGNLGGLAHGMNNAITSVGFGIGNGHSNFSANHNSLGGVDYGLLSAGDDSSTGNTGVKGKGPLIKNTVEFSMTVANGFQLSELGNSVVFQYGSALAEPHFAGNAPVTPTPEPGTLALAGTGMLGLAQILRRKLL